MFELISWYVTVFITKKKKMGSLWLNLVVYVCLLLSALSYYYLTKHKGSLGWLSQRAREIKYWSRIKSQTATRTGSDSCRVTCHTLLFTRADTPVLAGTCESPSKCQHDQTNRCVALCRTSGQRHTVQNSPFACPLQSAAVPSGLREAGCTECDSPECKADNR